MACVIGAFGMRYSGIWALRFPFGVCLSVKSITSGLLFASGKASYKGSVLLEEAPVGWYSFD